MQLLEDVLLSMNESIPLVEGSEPNYDDLLMRAEQLGYPMRSADQRQYARDLVTKLMALVPEIERRRTQGHSFDTNAPRPKPDLRGGTTLLKRPLTN